jgi:hypothetical protein
VTSLSLGTGIYEVSFGRDVSACAFLATQGGGSIGSTDGAIIGLTDRAGNANAVFATTRDHTSAFANRDFQLLVVC